MDDELLVNRVVSYSTGTPGRSLNHARGHHFVIDEPAHVGGPGEEIVPAEAFLAGVSACGVLLVETFAREAGVPLARIEATIEGVRHPSDTSVFRQIDLAFRISGTSQAQAEELVERYKEK